MDPQDRPQHRLAGAECAACGTVVSRDAVRILAERDDLAFVAVDCPACGSESLAILVGPNGDGPTTTVEPTASGGPSVDYDDVVAMREFLAAYEGDLRGLVGTSRPDRRESTGPA
jgi:hypothetical protein